mmetsp:Transcript_93148/g.184862  ORF Transcript_93148/g.184862 Transcript_93148/m.184862 type:complete len:219 (-) Transcript_93148:846-1502(-)
MLPALSSGGGFLRKTPLSAGTAVLFGSAASGGKTAFAVGGRSCTGEAGPSTDVAASGACLPESAGSASAGADGNVALAACWDEVRVLLRLAATSPTAGGSVHECATLAKPQHWNQDSTVLYAWNATLAPPQSFGFLPQLNLSTKRCLNSSTRLTPRWLMQRRRYVSSPKAKSMASSPGLPTMSIAALRMPSQRLMFFVKISIASRESTSIGPCNVGTG